MRLDRRYGLALDSTANTGKALGRSRSLSRKSEIFGLREIFDFSRSRISAALRRERRSGLPAVAGCRAATFWPSLAALAKTPPAADRGRRSDSPLARPLEDGPGCDFHGLVRCAHESGRRPFSPPGRQPRPRPRRHRTAPAIPQPSPASAGPRRHRLGRRSGLPAVAGCRAATSGPSFAPLTRTPPRRAPPSLARVARARRPLRTARRPAGERRQQKNRRERRPVTTRWVGLKGAAAERDALRR